MKNKRENGEVVVEASIIVTLVFIVISIMFYIGMVLYQQTAISTVANRIIRINSTLEYDKNISYEDYLIEQESK